MNSREKQRKAMHAKGGALARVRQLPLYMKIINVVLAVVLALGVGANWAYAAELLPEGNEAVPLAQDSSKTLTAASVAKSQANESVTYGWQILNQETGDFIEINGEVASTITVDYAMLKNQLDENNATTVRSVVYDSSEKVIAQKDYYISMDMNMKTIGEAVQANALASFPGGETLYAEGEANAESNASYDVTIIYIDSSGHELFRNVQQFSDEAPIKWFVQLPGGYTTTNATSDDPNNITIAYEEPDLKLPGLYITSKTALTKAVTINAVVSAALHDYNIIAKYETTTTGEYGPEETIERHGDLGGELGTQIPTENDITYLTTSVPGHGEGWEVSYLEAGKTVKETLQTVSVKLARTYSTLYFDLNDGTNGPVAVYIKQGVSFNTVKAWKQGTTNVYLPTPTPFKTAFNFVCWNTAKDGSGKDMPTDNWATDDNPAPGKDTTYYAKWQYSGTSDSDVTVVLAYWGETSEVGGEYEYLEERYDTVKYSQLSGGYILPINGLTYEEYSPQKSGSKYLPKTDRRYPQIRKKDSSGDDLQFELDDTTTKTLQIPNLNSLAGATYDYDDLYFYAGDDTHKWNASTKSWTIKAKEVRADGSTVINIALKRKVFKLEFGNTTFSRWTGAPTSFMGDRQAIFGRWGQRIYGTYHSTGSAADKVIEDPRYPGQESKYQYGFYYMRNYYSCYWWYIVDSDESDYSTQAASLFAYMPYDSSAVGWVTHGPKTQGSTFDPYSPSTSPANYYWGGLKCSTYSNANDGDNRYYLQTVGASFMHWGRDSGHSKTLSNRIDTLKYSLKEADNEYNNNNPKYQYNFGESTSTFGVGDGEPNFKIGSSEGSTLVNVFVDFLGFQSLIAPNSSHPELQQRGYDSPLRGSNPADPSADSSNSRGRSGGWSFYYKRNTFPLYIKNIYGSEPVYDKNGNIVAGHYDYCIEFNNEVQYATPITEIKFNQGTGAGGYEQGEPSKGGTKVDGLTGIKNDDKLSATGFVTTTANLRVPESLDKNLVFDGWYEDSGFESKIDFSTWKMPNHQQDIYAKWVKPQEKLRYNYWNPNTGQWSQSQVYTVTYDENIPVNMQPETPVETETARFDSWYYLTKEQDIEENRVYFNPAYMKMPHVTYSKTADGVLDLYTAYTTETNTEYTFKFCLYDGSETNIEVAPAATGRCDYFIEGVQPGDTPTFYPDSMDDADFYVQYRGILEPVSTKPVVIDPVDKDATKNVRTIYYKYNKEFKYQIVYQYAGKDGNYHEFYNSGWKDNSHTNFVTYSVPVDDQVNPTIDGKTYPVKLVSTSTITKNLNAGQDPANILYFNYAMNDDVTFNYKTATFAKAQAGESELAYHGGSVNPEEQTVAVILPDGQFSSSTATAFNGFKFVGWYGSTNGNIDFSKPIGTAGDPIIKAPKNADGFYMEGATYFAAFEYADPITIEYNVRAAKSIDAAGNPQDEIDVPGGITLNVTEQEDVPIWYEGTKFVGSTVQGIDNSGFYAYRWEDKAGNVVKSGTGVGTFVPQPVQTTDYKYYEKNEYTLWIIEKGGDDQPTITYKVSTGQESYGDVALNSSPAAKGDSVFEKLAPYSGVAVGAIASISSQMYEFKGWSNTDGGEIISGSTEKFVPTKADGELWTDKTYYAVFELNQVTIKFTTDGHGTLKDSTGVSVQDLTATVNDVFDVTSSTAATYPGRLSFSGPDTDYKVDQFSNTGYKFKEWLLVDPADPAKTIPLPVSKTIIEDMTFIATFQEVSVLVQYKPVDVTQGKVKEDSDYGQLGEIVRQNVSMVAADPPATVTAYPEIGYKFDYWTIDNKDTHYQTLDSATVQLEKDKDGDPVPGFYSEHTLWAHFTTYNLTVVFTKHKDWNEDATQLTCVEGDDDPTQTTFTIQSNSTFTYESVKDDDEQPAYGLFKITPLGESEPTVIEKISSTNTEVEYLTWLRDKDPSGVHSYVSLPSPPVFNEAENTVYTIAGVLQARGTTEYQVTYWQETVEAAISDEQNPGNPHPHTAEYYEQVKQVKPTGNIGGTMVYDPISYEGFKIVNVTYNPESKLIPPVGSTGTVDIYYDRQEDYEFIVRSRTQTPESAGSQTPEYKITWVSDLNFIDWHLPQPGPEPVHTEKWKGIYGAKFIIFDEPFGSRQKEVVYETTDGGQTPGTELQKVNPATDPEVQSGGFLYTYWNNYSGTTDDSERPWTERRGNNAHYYVIGDRSQYVTSAEYPGKGVCDVTYKRATNYPYLIRYHRQAEDLQGWEDNYQLMGWTDSIDGQEMTIVEGGSLKTQYNFESSTEAIPNPAAGGPTTWDKYLEGFEYNSCVPVNGKLITDTWGGASNLTVAHYDSTLEKWVESDMSDPDDYYYAVMDVYYTRATDTPYTISYYQETPESALARYNATQAGTTVPKAQYKDGPTDTPADVDHLTGTTGLTIPFTTDTQKYAGFTWVSPSMTEVSAKVSETEVTVEPDGSGNAKVYFMRNIKPADSPSFTVKYFLQNVDGEAAATTYTEQAETKTVKAFADAKIYVTGEEAQELSGIWTQIYTDYSSQGFTFSPQVSKENSTGKLGYEVVKANNSTVVKLYYNRNTNNKVTVKYMKETLNPVTQDPTGEYVEVEADRVNINGGHAGDPVATVVTGANFNFASYVEVNKYRNGTTGEVGFDFDHTNPAYGSIQADNYYVKVKADGTTTVEIFYKRVKDNIPVTVHYWAKDLDAETWTTKIADDVTDKLSTGQTYAAPIKEIAGYKWDHSDPAIQYAYPYKDNGDLNSYVLNVYYTRLTNVTYKVETYYETVEHAITGQGGEWILPPDEITATGTTGDEINKGGRYTPEVPGFTLDSDSPEGDLQIKGDGTSVMKVYYRRASQAAGARVEVYLETWQHAVDASYKPDWEYIETKTYIGYIDEERDLQHEDWADAYRAAGYIWNAEKSDAKAKFEVDNKTYKVYFDCDKIESGNLKVVAHYETLDSAVAHKNPEDPGYNQPRAFEAQTKDKTDFGAENDKLYIGRVCSMVPGEGFLGDPDDTLKQEGFYFDADYNNSAEAHGLSPAATYPNYTIHVGDNNEAHVYYLRLTNISFTVHYKLETPGSYNKNKDHEGNYWDSEAASEAEVTDKTHYYSDQLLSPYSGQFTYQYTFDLTHPTDWSIDIPGYKVIGYKDYNYQKMTKQGEAPFIPAPVSYDVNKNEYYIFYLVDASIKFTVDYYCQTYASAERGDSPETAEYDKVEAQHETFYTYLRGPLSPTPTVPGVKEDFVDAINMKPLKKTIDGYSWYKMSPVELSIYVEQSESDRHIDCYYTRDYYEPPTSAGYTATYWANKIVDGKISSTEFEYLGEKEFDAIFQEKVYVHPREAALLQKSVKGKEKLVEDFGEEYLFDHADYTADTTAESFTVDTSHTQRVRVYYTPYLGPNPPAPQEAAFTVTYKGLSVEAAKAGGAHERTDYTDTLTTINFGAWPDAKITLDYKEPLDPKNEVNQIIPGFTLNANLVDINGSAATTPWELDLGTADKQTGNKITLYYDRDVYDPPTNVGYKINHMVQSLDYLLHGIGEEYVWQQTDDMSAVYGETVLGSYDDNTDMKAKIDAFIEANPTETGDPGFSLREVDPISPTTMYIDQPNTYEFNVFYDRGYDKEVTFKSQRMIKNPDFITGTSDVEYLPYEEPVTCYPLYQQKVINAGSGNIWKPIDGYTFENRCNPDELVVPEPEHNSHLLKASASNDDLGTIQGFYDLTVYPTHEDITAQTGDVLAGIIGALAVTGLIGLGLFLAMNRRKNRYVPKH